MKEELEHLISIYKSDIKLGINGQYFEGQTDLDRYESRLDTLRDVVDDLERILKYFK